MSSIAAANRYAVALFDLAKEQNILDDISAELKVVKQVFQENDTLQKLLQHPKVSSDQKQQLIEESFTGLSVPMGNLLKLLLKKQRMDAITYIVDKFQELLEEERKVANAVVYTVKPLTSEEETMISTTFSKKLGKDTLHITNEIDPSIIGGMKIQIGDTIFDGSVKGQLNRLERELVPGKR
ncbi:F0F1 ATP synthase subunit delta [Alteribacillus iranensis]|uniref:ATP synthase subunit delta n=1 Tax=Alteribacillus iranensis TaxID=930128 RepID=A0A1I2BYN4_9BACI|nr:F0F1 ATP synthase subunit delta [Alteribacillus iranensis]SFE61251.1 ATP synthase F1 subcomplex delta subunit [Alteribacillus iranensis]